MLSCLRCGSKDILAGKVIMASGGIHVAWWCNQCSRYARPGQVFLSKDEKAQFDIDTLPVISDYLVENKFICARCGEAGAENHHWAPEAIFTDYHEWPQSYLCLKCHRRWHAEMNAWREKPLRIHHIAVTIVAGKAHVVVKDEKHQPFLTKDIELKCSGVEAEWEAVGHALTCYQTTQDNSDKTELRIYSDLSVIDYLVSLDCDSVWLLSVYRQLAANWNGRWNVVKIAQDRILNA